jgi:hypothetical protein
MRTSKYRFDLVFRNDGKRVYVYINCQCGCMLGGRLKDGNFLNGLTQPSSCSVGIRGHCRRCNARHHLDYIPLLESVPQGNVDSLRILYIVLLFMAAQCGHRPEGVVISKQIRDDSDRLSYEQRRELPDDVMQLCISKGLDPIPRFG